jgi:hypothetical protein
VKQQSLNGNEVSCIAIRSDRRSVGYAGTRFGGLYKSVDGGASRKKIAAQEAKSRPELQLRP